MNSQWNGIKHNEIKSHYSFFPPILKIQTFLDHTLDCREVASTFLEGRTGAIAPPRDMSRQLKQLQIAFKLGVCVCAELLRSCLTLFNPILQPARLLCPLDSQGKNIGVGCHALLQALPFMSFQVGRNFAELALPLRMSLFSSFILMVLNIAA